MRRALRPTQGVVSDDGTVTLPAPIGGWNTRDGYANMPITDAIALDNFFPEATDVRPRAGSDTYASGLWTQVESIFSYSNGPNLKLFVAVGTTFQNVSTVAVNGTVNAASTVAGGFTNSRWQYKNFGTPGGKFLVAVNGVDARQIFDGTVWFSGSVSSAGTIAAFSNLEVFQRRLFYTEKDTLRFIYHTNTDSIGGTVSAFDLGSLLDMGGYLRCISTWTRDGGAGMEDNIAFISNKGQVAVYQGIDPSSANTWSLIGVYKIGAPLSERSADKYGGELLISTDAGVVPLSVVLSGLVQQAPVTDKIRQAITSAVAMYRGRFGWQLKYVAYLDWLILNVPVNEGAFQQQYVMNSDTKAWCRFQNLSANVWEVHNNQLYFGANGKLISVNPALTSDDGSAINVDGRQAPTTFGVPGRLKHFKLFRPLVNTDGNLSLAADINVDFSDLIPTNIPTPVPVTTAVWDVATWDDYFWADGNIPALFWNSSGRLGTYGSIRMAGAVNSTEVRWYGTDVVFEVGGML